MNMDVYVIETQRSKKMKENERKERECDRSNNELWKWRN
jgi:hypothetical protein